MTQPAPAAQAQPEAPATPAPATGATTAAALGRPPSADRTRAQVRRMARTAQSLSRRARGTPLEPDARLLGEQLAHLHTLLDLETCT